jgi:hypothetical protein
MGFFPPQNGSGRLVYACSDEQNDQQIKKENASPL